MHKEVQQIPTDEIIARIPTLDSDLSTIEQDGMSSEELAGCVAEKDYSVKLQVSGGASVHERKRIEDANNILRARGQSDKEIQIVDAGDTDEITKEITMQIVANARNAFAAFINELLLQDFDKAGSFKFESDNYIVGRYKKDCITEEASPSATVEEMHFWANLGISKEDQEERTKVYEFIDDIRRQFSVELSTIVETLEEHPIIKDETEITRALILAMLSNMVRGIYYYHAKPSEKDRMTMYKPRHLGVKALKEAGHVKISSGS